MIPFALPAAIKALPWRLIGAATLVVAFMLAGWRVSTWHDGYRALQATEKALATSKEKLQRCTDSQTAAALAYAGAVTLAETTAAADRATAERIEDELKTNLAAADARGRDLARRLQDDRARRCSSAVPPVTGAAAEPAAPAQEPGDGDAVDRATADHFAACALDAVDLAGWQEWWEEVKAGRM